MVSSGIGVVGGGQLALMLAQAARGLDIPCHVQAAAPGDPAATAATSVVLGDSGDTAATRTLAGRCGAISFENEWLPLDALDPLEAEGIRFVPSLRSLAPLVSKRAQRALLDAMAIPGPRWLPLEDLAGAAARPGPPAGEPLPPGWSFPVMAKASEGGYDGHGTRLIPDASALRSLIEAEDPAAWLIEEHIAFERELALVACRDRDGRVATYPLVETHQHGQICDWVLAPAAVGAPVLAHARNVAGSLLTDLGYVGVLAIEFFWGPQGLLVNELAPRTHNSGHYTIEACATSQFAQQARVVAGLPMAEAELSCPGALMVNLLGLDLSGEETRERLERLRRLPGAHLHWYGKQGGATGRKLGHVTVLLSGRHEGELREEAAGMRRSIRSIWPLPEAHRP